MTPSFSSAIAISLLLVTAEIRPTECAALSCTSFASTHAGPTNVRNSRRHRTPQRARINGNADTDELNEGTSPSSSSSPAPATARSSSSSNSAAARPGSLMAATLETGRVPYGEQSRKYRRTVFGHDDWVRHRDSTGRIFENIGSMLFSGVVRQLLPEVSIVTATAAFVVCWNALAVPFFASASGNLPLQLPLLCLPSLPFQLSSPALGLLLVFRTNASYARWMEARNTWARAVAHGRNLIRMGGVFCDDRKAVERLGRHSWLYCRTVMNSLLSPQEDEEAYREAVREVFAVVGDDDDAEEELKVAERVVSSTDRVMASWRQLSLALHGLPVPDPKALIETDKSIIILGECTATCQKTFSSPVPLVYTRHTGRFLSLWTLLLPLGLYPVFVNPSITGIPLLVQGLPMVPAASAVALFLFGIDELAMQLEEPFSILPMKQFCDQVLDASKNLSGDCSASGVMEKEEELR